MLGRNAGSGRKSAGTGDEFRLSFRRKSQRTEGGEGVNNAMKISMIEALVPAASSTKSN
jgi:hypothetical protein